jgi:transglutaminase-like putative cysteine protease
MKYKVTHTTKYSYSEAVPVCHNLVHLAPRDLPHQTCDDFRLLIHPEPIEFSHRTDYFGNDVSYFAIDQAHRGLTVTATSQVNVSAAGSIKASETLPWDELVRRLRGLCETLVHAGAPCA